MTKRRTEAWLTRWLGSPEKMLETDHDAKAMLKEYNNLPMPNQNLSEAEIRQFIRYFKWADAQPAGSSAMVTTKIAASERARPVAATEVPPPPLPPWSAPRMGYQKIRKAYLSYVAAVSR